MTASAALTASDPKRVAGFAPLRLLPGGRTQRHPIAVYRRRRLAVVLAALAVASLALAAGWVAFATVSSGPPGARISATRPDVADGSAVIVQPGDTLWSISRRLAGQGDVRALVDRFAASRGIAPLQPGEKLALTAERPG